MMKLVLTLFFAWCFVSVSSGQQSEPTGARAKNKKAWNRENTSVKIYHTSEKEIVTGPKARNRKIWKRKDTTHQIITGKKRADVTGPRFKNRKPWQK
ncbi:hypothetical protein [Sinomicrobium weinanense]|uniref:Secreted protein n=1 Tax=Sinomicrobium weinanense TaxID=2842200 RepID=A0A926Q3J5_9FLAO|nr:hypothetical protein [Sinomicrobium weinanense]MBC9796076.1 hypothetical protein [Sinomicrobium weinanense]MBU3124745.1 hypothetical protein [Sinomicrobium weinanense]